MICISKHLVMTVILVVLAFSSTSGASPTASEKDSLRNEVCRMAKDDQLYRDSLNLAFITKDSVLIQRYVSKLKEVDDLNFRKLESIIRSVGFPNPTLLGKGTCYPFGIMYHWSKTYPGRFNDSTLVEVFRDEVQRNNLPLSIIDMAHFLYVSFVEHGMENFQIINHARVQYGLKPYTEREFMKIDKIVPMTK